MPQVDPPVIPSGKEIYDMLMREIEPELVSDSLSGLDAKYKDETEEEKKARKEKYKQAFIKYDEAYEKYMSDLEDQVHKYRLAAMKGAEEKDKKGEENKLNSIEEAINTA